MPRVSPPLTLELLLATGTPDDIFESDSMKRNKTLSNPSGRGLFAPTHASRSLGFRAYISLSAALAIAVAILTAVHALSYATILYIAFAVGALISVLHARKALSNPNSSNSGSIIVSNGSLLLGANAPNGANGALGNSTSAGVRRWTASTSRRGA